jgi:hypothetical protein
MVRQPGSHLSPYQALVCPDLPPRDPLGALNGKAYKAFLKPTDSRRGKASYVPCTITDRGHVLHSGREQRVHYWLHLQPGVIDWREQYPFGNQEVISRYLDAGKRIPRSKVPTFDVVYTLAATAEKPIRYGVIYVKEDGEFEKSDVQRRFARERDFCLRNGWRYRIMTDELITKAVGAACRDIVLWAGRSNLASDMDRAKELAVIVRDLADGRSSLEQVVLHAASILGYSRADAYRYFSVASVSKLIEFDISKLVDLSNGVDHSKGINLHAPFSLL